MFCLFGDTYSLLSLDSSDNKSGDILQHFKCFWFQLAVIRVVSESVD